jgi:hypothetical protein
MRAFVLAMLAMAAISVGAWYGLNMRGFGSGDYYASSGVSLPGSTSTQ